MTETSEQGPKQPSLVEQDIARIDANIDADFADPNKGLTRTLREAGELLETNGFGLTYAVIANDFFEDAEADVLAASSYPNSTTRKYQLDKDQIKALNTHPYVRTTSVTELVTYLDADGTLIREVVKDLGINPAMPANVQAYRVHQNQERFNKDQIAVIGAEIKQRTTPPEDLISLNELASGLRRPTGALMEAANELGIKLPWYRDPVSSEGMPYMTKQAAARIIQHLLDSKDSE